MAVIDIKELSHKFNIKDSDGNIVGEKWVVKDMDFTAHKGQFIAILGRNGSGKSTFARHLNGLLVADKGIIYIYGQKLNEDNLIETRQKVGMVFQNPDNQIVGNTVTEDVAFGPENLGIAPEEILDRISDALAKTELSSYADRNTSALSGGQKQRLAIASILAMKPQCIVLDEATSMLDPNGASKIMEMVKGLNKEYGMTVIIITHHIYEAVNADYIYVMDDGDVCMKGNAVDILKNTDKLREIGLESIVSEEIYSRTYKAGLIASEINDNLKTRIITVDDVVDIAANDRKVAEYILDLSVRKEYGDTKVGYGDRDKKIVTARNLCYSYRDGQDDIKALNNISFDIYKEEILAVAGKTGSGKSTMLQLLDGLLKAKDGELNVCGIDVMKTKNLKSLRQKIGYAFQYPEHQLFESTVLLDVAYGPINYGMEKEKAFEAAKEALELVGIDEEYFMNSPFDLSGGQKKRVALAGVLACKPELLILDEPAAGLDRRSKDELFALIKKLRDEKKTTVIFISHDMDDIYELADRILVLKNGEVVYQGDVEEAFVSDDKNREWGICKPEMMQIACRMKEILSC